MSKGISISPAAGVKITIDFDTYLAIRRAIRIFADDKQVAAYAAAPSEGVTPQLVAQIRRRMVTNGYLPERAYSRRKTA